MKSFAILALGAGAAMAQSLTDLPQCGQTCINNMITIASNEFHCSTGDAVCYCQEVNFGYGVRDCANQHCGADVAPAVIAYGASYCENAVASASTTGAAIGPLTSALATLPTTGLATATGGEGQSTAITTSALVATVTGTDGSTFVTTTGFVTLYSSIDAAASSVSASIESAASSASASLESVASSVSGSLASAASSVHASLSSAASSALASGASHAASVASSLASGATGGASSTGGAAPMMTGFPIVGAAGMAAWLLL